MTDKETHSGRNWTGHSPAELRTGRFPLLATVLAFVIIYLVYMPGYMSNDSITFFMGARADELTLYHPPAMAWLFKLGIPFSKDQSAPFFLQTALLVGAFGTLASTLFRRRRTTWGFVALATLFPAFYPIWGILWKDVWFVAIGTMALSLTVMFWRTARWWLLAPIVFTFFLGQLVRFETVPVWAILATACILRLFVRKHGSLTLRNFAGAAVLGVMFALLLYILCGVINRGLTTRTVYQSSVMQYFDLFGITVRTGIVFLPPDVLQANPDGVTVSEVEAMYDNTTCNSFLAHLKNPRDAPFALALPDTAEKAAALSYLWRKTVLEHPRAYLTHRIGLWNPLLGTNGQPHHYPYHIGVSRNNAGLEAVRTGAKALAESYARFFVRDVRITHFPVCYMALTVLVCAGMVWLWKRGRRELLIAPVLSLLCGYGHLFVIMLAASAADFRYCLWFIYCVCVATFVVCCELTTRLNEPSSGPVSRVT